MTSGEYVMETGWVHLADVRCISCQGSGFFNDALDPDPDGDSPCGACGTRGKISKGCGGNAKVGPIAYCLAEELAYPREEFSRVAD